MTLNWTHPLWCCIYKYATEKYRFGCILYIFTRLLELNWISSWIVSLNTLVKYPYQNCCIFVNVIDTTRSWRSTYPLWCCATERNFDFFVVCIIRWIVWLNALFRIVDVFVSESKAKLTDVPRNIAVLEGGTVTMRCSTDRSDAIRWFRENFNRANKVFTGSQINKQLFPDYDINRTVLGQYDLMIDSVNTSHAGKYICQEVSPSQSYQSWSSSELVVVIGKLNYSVELLEMVESESEK